MNISEALQYTKKIFEKTGIDSSTLDAQIILAYILKTEKHKLLTESERKLSRINFCRLRKLIKRRVKGEPVAYITGRKEFYSINFSVTKDVLIPRPETERIVDLAAANAKMNGSVLDIGTGSGAIAVSLKKNRPDLTIHACDISVKALKIAKRNAEMNLGRKAVLFKKSNLFSAYKEMKFDMILSNPPYLRESDKNTLQKEIFFEPVKALFTNDDGLKIITCIIKESKIFLNNSGILILEFGNKQETRIKKIASNYGFSASIIRDYTDFPRYALLQ